MLNNWLKPLSQSQKEGAKLFKKYELGQNITMFLDDLPDMRQKKIALVGVTEKEANEIRHYLYRMTDHFPTGAIVDLGNLRKPDTSFAIPLIYELIAGKVLPVLIGGQDANATAQFMAYQEAKSVVSMAAIDEVLRMGDATEDTLPGLYDPILLPRHPLLFHFSLIGVQAHYAHTDGMDACAKQHFDVLRLGKAKSAIEETEPILRDADLVAFHLAALKKAEAPGVENATPSGFFCEEACQICRYAGMSDKLTSFGIYGYKQDLDSSGQTAQVAAQMVWYFLDGFFGRKNDFPVSTAGLTEYIVDLPMLRYQITFWKSIKSGRWWMQIPTETKRKHQRHRLVPCSFQDYQSACQEELPERLLRAFQRFGLK